LAKGRGELEPRDGRTSPSWVQVPPVRLPCSADLPAGREGAELDGKPGRVALFDGDLPLLRGPRGAGYSGSWDIEIGRVTAGRG